MPKLTDNNKDKGKLISLAEELIQSFNPVCYSIDTYCQEKLGDFRSPDASPDVVFVQQLLYGWYRERAVIDAFIKNFYADYSSRILRADRILYSIMAYLSIFCIDEIGFNNYKQFIVSQDPTKMSNFIEYLFSHENLNSGLKAEWVKVRDIAYVDDEIIATIHHHMKKVLSLFTDLNDKQHDIDANKAAIEESKKTGLFGVKKVISKEPTRPITPNLTPMLPNIVNEPERILNKVAPVPMPTNLNNINLSMLDQKHVESLENQRLLVQSKYQDPNNTFQFQSTSANYTSKIESLKKEVEETKAKELAFDSSFHNKPPDFTKMQAKVKVNAAAILREDFLFRKQQEQDVKVLKRYEEELRDASEFYQWQSEMKEMDEKEKLEYVQFRREQARQASEDAKIAMQKLLQDNQTIGNLLREQDQVIKEKKDIEDELYRLNNRLIVKAITEIRDTKPKEALEKIFLEKLEKRKQLTRELEEARIKKEIEDKREEELRADRIRQLKAEVNVHRKHINVFDPTESSGLGFLNEMSYMEMKERLEMEKLRLEQLEMEKREEIISVKNKKAKDLEDRALNIQKIRQKKAEATKKFYQQKRSSEVEQKEEEEKLREEKAIALAKELEDRREEKKRYEEALRYEEERIKRQQQYLGSNADNVEKTRNVQQLLAKERQVVSIQLSEKQKAVLDAEARRSDLSNRKFNENKIKMAEFKQTLEKEKELIFEKKFSLEKMKSDFELKKTMVVKGKQQHEATKTVKVQHNLYADRITKEVQQDSKAFKSSLLKSTSYSGSNKPF